MSPKFRFYIHPSKKRCLHNTFIFNQLDKKYEEKYQISSKTIQQKKVCSCLTTRRKILNFGEAQENWPWMLKPSTCSSSNIRNKWWWSFQLIYECVHMCENGKNVLSYAEFLYYWLKGREIKISLLEVCLTIEMFYFIFIKDPNVKTRKKIWNEKRNEENNKWEVFTIKLVLNCLWFLRILNCYTI